VFEIDFPARKFSLFSLPIPFSVPVPVLANLISTGTLLSPFLSPVPFLFRSHVFSPPWLFFSVRTLVPGYPPRLPTLFAVCCPSFSLLQKRIASAFWAPSFAFAFPFCCVYSSHLFERSVYAKVWVRRIGCIPPPCFFVSLTASDFSASYSSPFFRRFSGYGNTFTPYFSPRVLLWRFGFKLIPRFSFSHFS